MCERLLWIAVCTVAISLPLGPAGAEGFVKTGAGGYATELPAGAKEPPSNVFKTDNVRGPLPTNRWWSSLLWTKYSQPQYAHPLAVQAGESGLRVYYPGPAISVSPVGIMAGMPGGGQDFVLGHSVVAAFPDARLDGWSDWFVTASFASEGKGMKVSYGHGGPFVYAIYEGGSPKLTFAEAPRIWSGSAQAAVLGVTVGAKHYGLFGPTGATWSGLDGKTLTCEAKGKRYFSVAVLPDKSPETLALFQRYAYSHVTGTKVEWSYDEKASTVTTKFSYTTRAHEGNEAGTVFAMYPHQWRATSAELLDKTYESVRGVMKIGCGSSFTTRAVFPGVLPSLPDQGKYDKAKLRQYLEEEARAAAPGLGDTYWGGKRFGKLATLAPIAEQLESPDDAHGRLSAGFQNQLRQRLEQWFTPTDDRGQVKNTGLFYYNRTWGTLIGYPASYGSDTEVNDHHFHYGYFVKAAAEVARHDKAWASESKWGAMVRLLIRDIADPNRDDPMFPFLRSLDCYAGHSWASGHAKFGDGNNNESSSEAMNAWTAIILWGTATGDRQIRDLGIFLYTTEMEAINAYWFDVLGQNRPKAYKPSVVTMVWGGKGVNETWFSRKPELVHGINWLPIHGGSLYLGRYPEYVRRNYEALVAEKGGANWDDWACLVWMYRALDDPQDAIRQFNARADSFPLEAGNSKANVYHWIHNLAALGHVDRTVTADCPLYAVFTDGRGRTYVVYNMEAERRTVSFSDGVTVSADGKGFTVKRRELPKEP